MYTSCSFTILCLMNMWINVGIARSGVPWWITTLCTTSNKLLQNRCFKKRVMLNFPCLKYVFQNSHIIFHIFVNVLKLLSLSYYNLYLLACYHFSYTRFLSLPVVVIDVLMLVCSCLLAVVCLSLYLFLPLQYYVHFLQLVLITVKESDSDTIIMVIVLVAGVGGVFILFALMALCYRCYIPLIK